MKNVLKRAIAIVGTAALALTGVGLASAPALAADGVNGEVRGFLWGNTGNANWEGTYRMPGGIEAWCASVWQPEPIYATGWSDPERLTYNDGSYFPDSEMAKLAYVVSEASHAVLYQTGQAADTVAAATSVIVHGMTFNAPIAQNGNQPYNPVWALDAFAAGEDPEGTGQDPKGVPAVYAALMAEAALYSGTWSLTLDAGDTSGVKVGDTVPVTGQLLANGNTAVPSKEIVLNLTGATGPSVVTTDANGNLTFDVVATGENVSIDAHRAAPADTVTMRVPTGWTSARKPQNMIEVNNNEVTADVTFAASTISIGTSATDQSDGDRSLAWDGGVIIDAVAYENLVPSVEYTVTGELMDKATGLGTGITGSTTFTPETASGTVDVEFVVPSGHAGSTFVVFERLYNAEGELQATHEDIEDEAQTVVVEEQPTVGTSATDQSDGDRSLAWDGGVIIDAVAYENLVPSVEYTVTGELMDKATGLGTGITGSTTFTPETASGTVDVEFVVPSGHAGSTFVVFERLYNAEGVLQATHEDIEDEAQTVVVEEQPTLSTRAIDQSDGDKTLAPDGGVIVDHVQYTNLIVGKEYTVKGELMNKATGKGTGITGTATFVAETAEGVVKIEFVVPEGYAGETLVVFERLYDVEGVLQATHEDINDVEQTVKVSKHPEVPVPGTSGLATTGGDSMIPLTAGALSLVALGLVGLYLARRRQLI